MCAEATGTILRSRPSKGYRPEAFSGLRWRRWRVLARWWNASPKNAGRRVYHVPSGGSVQNRDILGPNSVAARMGKPAQDNLYSRWEKRGSQPELLGVDIMSAIYTQSDDTRAAILLANLIL